MPVVVITGTGTGVGKTYLGRALNRTLRGVVHVKALKPIESGYTGVDSDAQNLAAGDEWDPPVFAFEEPLAPSVAARRQGVEVDLGRVVGVVQRACAERTLCLVESAGGLFTPLNAAHATNLDLVKALEPCCWLLVAPNRLGVLSDVGAYLRAAQSEHRIPDRVVLNAAGDDPSVDLNAHELRSLWPGLAVDELGKDALPPSALLEAVAGPLR